MSERKNLNSIQQASVKIGKCPQWVRGGIRAEKIKCIKINSRIWLVTDEEIQRIKENPITVSREEMFG